jgi:hypothetical protein
MPPSLRKEPEENSVLIGQVNREVAKGCELGFAGERLVAGCLPGSWAVDGNGLGGAINCVSALEGGCSRPLSVNPISA